MFKSHSALIKIARSLARQLSIIGTVYRKDQNCNLKILDGIPEFSPNSAIRSQDLRADLTLQSAHQTFPFLKELVKESGLKLISPIDAQEFSSKRKGAASASKLKELFDKYGSDKATIHDYHLVYGSILSEPTEIHSILEIGLGTNNEDVPSNMGRQGKPGASLRAFRDYLPHACVFGADVDKRILFEEDRIETFFVDQTNIETVFKLSEQLPENIDLIVDDGLHSPNANIATLILASKKLKVGGWVVIEDIDQQSLIVWQVISSIMSTKHEVWLINGRSGLLFAAERLA